MFELNQSVTHLFHLARQRADEVLMSKLSSVGLTPRQFAVLYAISQQSGLSQTELTLATGSDRSTITDLVARLAKRGLLRRTRSAEDARAVSLYLTEKGQKSVAEAIPAVQHADDRLCCMLPEIQRQSFISALQAIALSGDPSD